MLRKRSDRDTATESAGQRSICVRQILHVGSVQNSSEQSASMKTRYFLITDNKVVMISQEQEMWSAAGCQENCKHEKKKVYVCVFCAVIPSELKATNSIISGMCPHNYREAEVIWMTALLCCLKQIPLNYEKQQ